MTIRIHVRKVRKVIANFEIVCYKCTPKIEECQLFASCYAKQSCTITVQMGLRRAFNIFFMKYSVEKRIRYPLGHFLKNAHTIS